MSIIKQIQSLSGFQKCYLAISILLYIVSLTQDTYFTDRGYVEGDSPGFLLVVIGWMGLGYGGACLAWLANPCLIVSWFTAVKGKRTAALILGILSVAFSISFFFFDTIIATEAGHYAKIEGYNVGYWLWTTSCVVMMVGSVISLAIRPKS